jgi:phosphotransferase system  glucose/maltose/N-acetylglucosamine-specific IIC component
MSKLPSWILAVTGWGRLGMNNLLQTFMSNAGTARGARSTALHALQWTLGIILASLVACITAKAPQWVFVFHAVVALLVIVTFLASYVYLLLKKPDALRSEHYLLAMNAMDKGLIGDDIVGIIDPASLPPSMRALPPSTTEDSH